MNEGELFLRGFGPRDQTKKEREKKYVDVEKAWEQAYPSISDINNAQSYGALYQVVDRVLPNNLRKIKTGKSPREKLESWANTPLSSFDYDEGLAFNLKGGEFLSDAAQMQHEFQEALKAKLKELKAKRSHLSLVEEEKQEEAS